MHPFAADRERSRDVPSEDVVVGGPAEPDVEARAAEAVCRNLLCGSRRTR
jgi:hypothetical protein